MEAVSSSLRAFAIFCGEFASELGPQFYTLLKQAWMSPGSSGYWVYSLAFLFWAALAFHSTYHGRGFFNFLRFCFPRKTYFHRSTFVDLQLFILNAFLQLPVRLLEGLGAPVIGTSTEFRSVAERRPV